MVKNKIVNNGLALLALATDVTDCGEIGNDDLKNINKFISQKFAEENPDYAVCYLNYGIRFARWEHDTLVFYEDGLDLEHLQLARIFNKNRELKIWKSDSGLQYRLRIDSEGEEYCAVEAEQILWGTRTKKLNKNWIRLYEDRGTELKVPLAIEIPEGQEVPDPRVCIKTRNYIGYLDNGQASLEDCRFMAIGKKLIEEG